MGGVPVAVTSCPFCNSGIVFDARGDGQSLEFGTTGILRNSDLIMYDCQTESWWQQFMGESIVGDITGEKLKMLPSPMESLAKFKERLPDGKILNPVTSFRGFGSNPNVGYDTDRTSFPYRGRLTKDMPAMTRIVVVGNEAWPLDSS